VAPYGLPEERNPHTVTHGGGAGGVGTSSLGTGILTGTIDNQEFVWSPTYVDALVLRDRDDDANPATSADERLYVQHDANFNTIALVNTSGTVQERYIYDPYGKATVLTGAWGSRSGTLYGWRYRFQGGRVDLTVGGGHYAFRNRDLNVDWSVWQQADPMVYLDGPNRLQFVADNPLRYRDPQGLSWLSDFFLAKNPDGTYRLRHGWKNLYKFLKDAPGGEDTDSCVQLLRKRSLLTTAIWLGR
jgi:RHS repeat-associated protein